MFFYLFSYCSVVVVVVVFLLQLQSDNRFGVNDTYILVGQVPQQRGSLPWSYKVAPKLLKDLNPTNLKLQKCQYE